MKITIPKRSTACQVCQKPFEAGQEIVSQLMEDFSRKDACLNCLTPAPKTTTWKQKYQQKLLLKQDDRDEAARAWELLQTTKDLEEAYILALYLIRKKILAKRNKEGLYEHLETGEMAMVEDVDLKKLVIPEIHARLQIKLR
jgi:hypothetical protein